MSIWRLVPAALSLAVPTMMQVGPDDAVLNFCKWPRKLAPSLSENCLLGATANDVYVAIVLLFCASVLWFGWPYRKKSTQRAHMIYGIIILCCGMLVGVFGLSIIAAGEREANTNTSHPPTKAIGSIGVAVYGLGAIFFQSHGNFEEPLSPADSPVLVLGPFDLTNTSDSRPKALDATIILKGKVDISARAVDRNVPGITTNISAFRRAHPEIKMTQFDLNPDMLYPPIRLAPNETVRGKLGFIFHPGTGGIISERLQTHDGIELHLTDVTNGKVETFPVAKPIKKPDKAGK